jgi:cbb3-type cytochrome oxidase subunit 3
MKQQILTLFPWPWLTALALIIFFTFFTSMIFLVFSRFTKKFIEEGQQLPLSDGEKYEQ